MLVAKLSDEQIEEQIELYSDRIEAISDHISESEDYSIIQVLRNQKEGYKLKLDLLYNEKRERKIKSAMNINSSTDINLLGTKWIGKFNSKKEEEAILIFYPNEILKYKDISSSWEIKDGKIVININNGFATMYGYIENNKLIGNAVNIQDQEWSFAYTQIDTDEFLKFSVPKNDEEETRKNKITESQILNLGKKWRLKNYILNEFVSNYVEICQNGLLKVNDDYEAKWMLKNGRIIFKINHLQVEYNGEILQNKIIGLAKDSEGKEWVFTGELIPEVVKPENSKTLRIKSENREFGLMAPNDETWNNFKLLDNGFYFEEDKKIILTSVIGKEYIATQSDILETAMHNNSFDEDKKSYDIFYGRNPNGGNFIIYRSKKYEMENEIIIGALNIQSGGIKFEIL